MGTETKLMLVVSSSYLALKLISGKRESVSQQHSMKIDEQWECLSPMRDKIEGTYRGEGTTPVTTACPEDRSLRVEPPTT